MENENVNGEEEYDEWKIRNGEWKVGNGKWKNKMEN